MRLLHEDERTFTVEGPSGPMRIAKAGIGPAMVQRIRGFARGGQVSASLPYTPATVPPLQSVPPDDLMSMPPAEEVSPAQPQRAQRTPPSPAAPSIFSREHWANYRFENSGFGRTAAGRWLSDQVDQMHEQARREIAESNAKARGEVPGAPAHAPQQQASQGPVAGPPTEAQPPQEPEAEPALTPEELQGWSAGMTTGEAPPQPAGASGAAASVPAAPAAVRQPEWLTDATTALDEKATALQDAAAPVEDTPEIQAARQEEEFVATGVRRAREDRDEMKRILEQHPDIDPNRYWHDMNAGQRVGVVLGMLLSGIGSGLLRTQNAAERVIQNAIQRDIAAQRADLGKVRSLYSDAVETLKSEEAGLLLAQARTKDLVAAAAEQQARKRAAAVGAADAKLLAAKLQREADLDYQQAYRLAAQQHLQRQELDLRRQQVGLQRQQTEAEQARHQAVERVVDAVVETGPVDGRFYRLLQADPRYGERAIRLPDGRVTIAVSTKSAGELRNDLTTYEDVLNGLARYEKIAKDHPTGWQAGAIDNATMKVGKQLHEYLTVRIARMHEKGVLSDQDLERYKRIIPDVTDSSLVWNSKLAQLKSLRQVLGSGLTAKMNSHSIGRRQPMSSEIDSKKEL